MSAPRTHVEEYRRAVEEDIPETGPTSLLFEYDPDFGREHTIVISRLQAPSEIPRPDDYVERLPAAYYLSVDPRFRVVLMTPTYDTVAAISFASYKQPVVELIELPDGPETGPANPRKTKKLAAKSTGAKTRFSGDLAGTMTWERQAQGDTFDLWASETIPGLSQNGKRLQTRRVGTMKRSTVAETSTRRVLIEANTTYVGEAAVLASAITVLKKEVLHEKQTKLPSFKPTNVTSFRGFAIAYPSTIGA